MIYSIRYLCPWHSHCATPLASLSDLGVQQERLLFSQQHLDLSCGNEAESHTEPNCPATSWGADSTSRDFCQLSGTQQAEGKMGRLCFFHLPGPRKGKTPKCHIPLAEFTWGQVLVPEEKLKRQRSPASSQNPAWRHTGTAGRLPLVEAW